MFTNKNSRIFLYQTFKSNTPKSKTNKNYYNNNMKKTPKDVAKNW